MSVPVARRTPGKLKVETVCFELCNTTRKLLCNEKLFPKRSHWLGGARHIADAASLMMLFIFTANDIKVKTPKEARDRHELQTLAIALHGALEKRMTFEAFYWETNPNLYSVWADLMNQEGRLLRNWMYKDEQRYADLLALCDPEDCHIRVESVCTELVDALSEPLQRQQ